MSAAKFVSSILILILIAVVAVGLYGIVQNNLKNSAVRENPSPSPVSQAPSTSSPREVKKIDPASTNQPKIEYKLAKVDIRNFSANPASLTVQKYTVVSWKNYDKEPHRIVGDKWQSRSLKQNEVFSQAFEKPGNYYYKDPENPQLAGVVIVTD